MQIPSPFVLLSATTSLLSGFGLAWWLRSRQHAADLDRLEREMADQMAGVDGDFAAVEGLLHAGIERLAACERELGDDLDLRNRELHDLRAALDRLLGGADQDAGTPLPFRDRIAGVVGPLPAGDDLAELLALWQRRFECVLGARRAEIERQSQILGELTERLSGVPETVFGASVGSAHAGPASPDAEAELMDLRTRCSELEFDLAEARAAIEEAQVTQAAATLDPRGLDGALEDAALAEPAWSTDLASELLEAAPWLDDVAPPDAGTATERAATEPAEPEPAEPEHGEAERGEAERGEAEAAPAHEVAFDADAWAAGAQDEPSDARAALPGAPGPIDAPAPPAPPAQPAARASCDRGAATDPNTRTADAAGLAQELESALSAVFPTSPEPAGAGGGSSWLLDEEAPAPVTAGPAAPLPTPNPTPTQTRTADMAADPTPRHDPMTDTLQRARQEADRLRTDLQSTIQRFDAIQSALGDADRDAEAAAASLRETEQALQAEKTVRERAESRLAASKEEVKSLFFQLDETQKGLQSVISASDQREKELRGQITELEGKLAIAELAGAEAETLRAQVHELDGKLEARERTISGLEEQVSKTQAQLVEQRAANDRLQKEIDGLRKQAEATRKTVLEKDRQFESATQLLNKLRPMVEALEGELNHKPQGTS